MISIIMMSNPPNDVRLERRCSHNIDNYIRRVTFKDFTLMMMMLRRAERLTNNVTGYSRRVVAGAVHSRWISYDALTIERTNAPKEIPKWEGLRFGTVFSDHMLTANWDVHEGWENPQIKPFQDLSLSPAASSLHYAMQCFEGMKAYKAVDGSIRLFRPELNMNRLRNSMKALSMPTDWSNDDLLDCIKELVRLDRNWIPDGEGYSLYLRPTAISTHPYIGLAPTENVLLYCITMPVGPYYSNGFKPVRLTADCENVRAWPGGTGNAKIGGNYGPTVPPSAEAEKRGYDQVLWLFGEEHTITEVGCMNVFFVMRDPDTKKKQIVTAPLTRGDILPGITRQSIIELVKGWGADFEVVERFPTMPEIHEAAMNGNLIEAFGAGTAAVVAPISCIEYKGVDIEIHATGEVAKRVWKELTDIQYGRLDGPDGWSHLV